MGSKTSRVSPAKSTKTFSPATWVWRMVGRARAFQASYCSQIAEAAGVSGTILLPKKRPRDAAPSQLAFDMGPIGDRPLVGGRACRRKQKPLKSFIVERVGQGPSQAGHAGALQITVHGAVADLERAGDQALPQAACVLEPQDFSNPAHGQSLRWHQASSRAGRGPRISRSDCRCCRPAQGCSRSRGIAAHDPVEQVLTMPWNACSRCRGTRTRPGGLTKGAALDTEIIAVPPDALWRHIED